MLFVWGVLLLQHGGVHRGSLLQHVLGVTSENRSTLLGRMCDPKGLGLGRQNGILSSLSPNPLIV